MVEEVNSFVYLIHYKNLCECHNVPLPITTIKEEEKKRNAQHPWHLSPYTCKKTQIKIMLRFHLTVNGNLN
jgi:hypothetical protein